MIVKVNGISMRYEVNGTKGRWLTLVHGAQDNLDVWWNQIPVISKKYRVLTYDWRGHGETETPDIEYSFDVMVKDLYELWKTLGIKETYLLGHSMGGGIAVRAALQHPDIVKALILMNSGVARSRPSKQEEDDLMEARLQRWAFIEKYGFWPYDDDDKYLTAEEKRYKAMKLKNDPKKYVLMIKTLHRPEPPPDVSKLDMPALVISGSQDDLGGPRASKVTQSLLKGSNLVILPTGHNPHIEAPDQLNQTILDFLNSLQ
ncbi:MAG: alpha/beta hydrolase [Chloroflexi bacterium]|nr:alpha/beta hydrolase [Chloroflexota bacterium]